MAVKKKPAEDRQRTLIPEIYTTAAALVRDCGLSPTQALKLHAHAATLLFDARGGYEALAADPEALDFDRAALWVLRLVPRASEVPLEEVLGLREQLAEPVVKPETS